MREHALRESEARFKTLFESAPDTYYLNDLNGIFLDGNRDSEVLTGYPREELIGQNFLSINFLPPGDIRRTAKLVERSARGEATGPDELTLNRKDGSQVPIEIRTYPVRIKDQTVVLGIAATSPSGSEKRGPCGKAKPDIAIWWRTPKN